MMYQNLRLPCLMVFLSLVVFVNESYANSSDQLSLAKQCSTVSTRLERLDCFDRVFNTPKQDTAVFKNVKPEAWSRGVALEKNRENGRSQALASRSNSESSSDIWLTLPSINQQGSSTILMMSCIDSITRIDLLTNRSIPQARVNISINEQGSTVWKSDDSGFVVSSARGIPAINLMKEVIRSSTLVLHSELTELDGLTFDTKELSTILAPLRQRCQW